MSPQNFGRGCRLLRAEEEGQCHETVNDAGWSRAVLFNAPWFSRGLRPYEMAAAVAIAPVTPCTRTDILLFIPGKSLTEMPAHGIIDRVFYNLYIRSS